jgi:hypothetical protein
MSVAKRGPGRPRKYGRPSKVVTVTLPEDVLARLASVDADLGRAIVRVAEHRVHSSPAPRPAELATYGRRAVIVVKPVKALERLSGIQLVPIGHGRALIALNQPRSIPQLELDLRDAIERKTVDRREKATLQAVADILRRTRHSRRTVLEERTIIVVEAKKQPGAADFGSE